ncbi:hypothetical protein [Methanosphaera sp. BMS]|uniref:hypothetical protein n=1 Tax=Methanosphaera sp. BMS TaxID=1789762 RepID=UPI001F2E6425|nr:hypothetical protein [Methanosphaera sp. BMS]
MDSVIIIADMAKYHDIFKFVCNGITPSERTIQRYQDEYGEYYESFLQMTLKKASEKKYTEFNHVAIDGTVKKAYNSNHNTISKKKHKYYFNTTKDFKLMKIN